MQEPVPPPGEPEPPDFLDDRAKAIWTTLVPQLSAIGLARRIDGTDLARYCALLVRWIDSLEFIRKNGSHYVLRAENGRITGHKEFQQNRDLRWLGQQLIALEREFGMTPASRSRLQVAAAETSSDRSELKRKFFSGDWRGTRA